MNQVITPEFDALIGEAQESFENAQFMEDWTPPSSPAGTRYACLFNSLKTGVKETDKGRFPWVRMGFQVQDGDYAGKTFGITANSQYPNLSKPLFDFASYVSHDPSVLTTRQVRTAINILEPVIGRAIVEVVAKSYVSKKTPGKTGTDLKVDRLIDIAE